MLDTVHREKPVPVPGRRCSEVSEGMRVLLFNSEGCLSRFLLTVLERGPAQRECVYVLGRDICALEEGWGNPGAR